MMKIGDVIGLKHKDRGALWLQFMMTCCIFACEGSWPALIVRQLNDDVHWMCLGANGRYFLVSVVAADTHLQVMKERRRELI